MLFEYVKEELKIFWIKNELKQIKSAFMHVIVFARKKELEKMENKRNVMKFVTCKILFKFKIN